jgi:hypothetical protein
MRTTGALWINSGKTLLLITNVRLAPVALSDQLSRHVVAGTLVVVLGLLLPIVVVWSVQFPGQFDAYNHLARHYLELLQLQGRPLPPGIIVKYRILPNLGGDLVIPPLIWVFGALPALKVFLTLSILLYWVGPAVFILQTGEYSTAAWVASFLFLPLVLDGAFFWGFLNYYSGVGLAFLVAAHLRYLDQLARITISSLLIHTALVVLLFFWHLAAVVIYGVLLTVVVLTRLAEKWRSGHGVAQSVMRAAVLCLPMLPVMGLYLVYAAGAGHGLHWPSPLRKMLMLFSVFHGYDVKADILVVVLWAAAALLFFGRSLRLARPGFAAWSTVIFLVLYAVLPSEIGTTDSADSRMLPALVVCALAWLGTLPVRWSWAGLVLLVGSIGARTADASVTWHRTDARLSDEARSFLFIEPGSSVLPLILVKDWSKENPETHFASLAVIERHAYVATLFAFADQQPLRLTGPTQLVSKPGDPAILGTNPITTDGRFTLPDPASVNNYDYLWVYNPLAAKLDFPPEWSRVFASERVTLWHRRKSAKSSEPAQ